MLVMINLAALGSIKNWPTIAELGLPALFYLGLGALTFFVPLSLIAAELSTTYPEKGGVFAWVEKAFGHRIGFLAAWLFWAQNLVWYPTTLSFIASTLTYIFNPDLATSKVYHIGVILACLCGTTYINLQGTKVSAWLSSLCTIIGIFIPSLIIISLGMTWIFTGNTLSIQWNWKAFLPQWTHMKHFVFFAGVILAYTGIEMSAVHAKEVDHPERNYPRALLYSSSLFLFLTSFGVLSIISSTSDQNLSLTSGAIQALSSLFKNYGLSFLTPVCALLIAVGALGSLSTWIAGPSKALLAATEKGDLPSFFNKLNAHGSPYVLLIGQCLCISLLSLLFLWMPSINAAYWMLAALCTELYLIMYLLMFAAAIKLRYAYPLRKRPFQIPWGKVGLWGTCTLGSLSALFAGVISFFPPDQLNTGNPTFYIGFLLASVLLLCLCPSLIFNTNHRK